MLVVEDMIDSGLTLHYIMRSLSLRGPGRSRSARSSTAPIGAWSTSTCATAGFTVPDDFFVGYGFDYRQLFRNSRTWPICSSNSQQPTLF